MKMVKGQLPNTFGIIESGGHQKGTMQDTQMTDFTSDPERPLSNFLKISSLVLL
jgi:hypothetical protein